MSSSPLESAERRWNSIEKNNPNAHKAKSILFDAQAQEAHKNDAYIRNVENFIGVAQIPIGVAGPLKVNGKSYYVPLATTEAALVASVARGCKVVSIAGGATARVVDQRVSRGPAFFFDNIPNAVNFSEWVKTQFSKFKELAGTTTRHGKLVNIHVYLDANSVHLTAEYSTGDASGQNIATFATKKILDYIKEQAPQGLTYCTLEGGRSSDKQTSSYVLHEARGRKTLAEVTISKEILHDVCGITPAQMVRQRLLWTHTGQACMIPGVGANTANVLAAAYIACGQDPACVTEGLLGHGRFELNENGDLYIGMTFCGLLVATVGGGTALPTQRACLDIVGCTSANEYAEVIAAACIAGEFSIVAAFCADEFAAAHFARSRAPTAKL